MAIELSRQQAIEQLSHFAINSIQSHNNSNVKLNLSTHSIDSNTTPSSTPDRNLPQSARHAHPYLSGCSGTPIDSDKSSSLNSSRSSLPVRSVNSEGSGLFANCSYPQLDSYVDDMISELSLTELQSSDLHQLAAVSQLTIDHCTIFIYFMFSGGVIWIGVTFFYNYN